VARLPLNPASRYASSGGQPRHLGWLSCALLVALPVLAVVVMPPTSARAATPEKLVGRPGAGEFQPVRGDNFIAWQQNTRRKPNDYNVFARELGGGGTFRVNPRRVNAANGDIDGDVLVYQQFRAGDSRLKLFDLVDRSHSNLPSEANSRNWEYWPSHSGDFVLFGRLFDSGVRTIMLLDVSTGTARRLDRNRVGGGFVDLAPGEVNGDWAVWHKCSSRKECDVIRYNIPDGEKTRMPNRGGRHYSPAVSSSGTVFFARSRGGCGSGVRLISRSVDGVSAVLTSLPSGDDVSAMDAYTDPEGTTTLLFDQFDCARAAVSDAWQIEEDLTPTLTVKVVGDGNVTSSPAGISCGSDCTETFEFGTGVTLTAQATAGATFAGWSGACTGSSSTCTLQMNGPRSVTATFSNKPVLTVTKAGMGSGTVTSTPAGINCGIDCIEPYNEGTSVTLTANPAPSSTFAGWSGACSGTAQCTVTMNVSKEVIATFTANPVTLTVSLAGDGSGTVTGTGIACPGDCSETYAPGTVVDLTATADAGSTFDSWGGACSGAGSCSVTMDSDKSVSALFVHP
jgi:hypothetical protein